MDDAQQYTPAQAADPSTPGEVLAAIAGSRPDLRPHIAANPATYPALLEWLAQLGDPSVDAALRARGLEDTMAGGQPAPTVDERTTGPGATDTATSEPSTPSGETVVAPAADAEREGATEGAGAPSGTTPATPGEAATTPYQPSTAYEPPAAYVPPAAATSGYSGGGTPAYPGAGTPGYPGGDTPAYSGTGTPGYPGTGTDQHAGRAALGAGDTGTPGTAPYGPPPGGPYGPPTGQPPKKSRTWLWILLGVLAVLLIGGILLAIFVVSQVNRAVDDAGDIFDTGEAQSYGDDAQLDALWDRCEGGDMVACDDLYQQSPYGSEYEEFGDTCGGRTDGDSWCEDLAEEGAAAGPGDGAREVVPALAGAGGVARTSSGT
jgi:hypothetical protein